MLAVARCLHLLDSFRTTLYSVPPSLQTRPPFKIPTGNSGGLSFSADYGAGGGLAGGGSGRDDAGRASLSTSNAGGMLSPISEGTPKSAKLEPLK